MKLRRSIRIARRLLPPPFISSHPLRVYRREQSSRKVDNSNLISGTITLSHRPNILFAFFVLLSHPLRVLHKIERHVTELASSNLGR